MAKYRTSIAAIDRAITRYTTSRDTPHANTTYLCRHSKHPALVAPLKAVMWPSGWRHASFSGADGGEARTHARRLGYVEEGLSQHALDDEPSLFTAVARLGLKKKPEELRIMRFVAGRDLDDAFLNYVAAETVLREALGRPHERRDVLRAMGEFLYCRLFKAIQVANPNQYGHDVVYGSLEEPTRKVQVKVARKAATNPAGIWIGCHHLDGDSFDVLALFWLDAHSRVEHFFELTVDELRAIDPKKGAHGFDLRPQQILNAHPSAVKRSHAKLARAAAREKLTSFIIKESG